MQKFKDKTGREWEIDLLFGEVLRINDDYATAFPGSKIDLLEPDLYSLEKRLDENLPFFWKVLWLTIAPQAAAMEPAVDAKSFGSLMAGSHLIEAQNAFFREWADFFHQVQRPDIAVALETTLMLRMATFTKVSQKLKDSQAMKNLPTQVDATIDRILSQPFEGLQASFDLILNDTPGENSGSDTKVSPAMTDQSPLTKPTSSASTSMEPPAAELSSNTSTLGSSVPHEPR